MRYSIQTYHPGSIQVDTNLKLKRYAKCGRSIVPEEAAKYFSTNPFAAISFNACFDLRAVDRGSSSQRQLRGLFRRWAFALEWLVSVVRDLGANRLGRTPDIHSGAKGMRDGIAGGVGQGPRYAPWKA